MMTIKEFASLCNCNSQTLRFYDRIGLLKPEKVDSWTGYRYYTETQAISFVKIKNLQAADFTIDEIKVLLAKSDQEVCDAFDRKILEQTEKLERMREIQRSYLAEKSRMEKLINRATDYLLQGISDYSILPEFGLSPDEGDRVKKVLEEYFQKLIRQDMPDEAEIRMTRDDETITGVDEISEALKDMKANEHTVVFVGGEKAIEKGMISPENNEAVWEKSGWAHVHEFMNEIPGMDDMHEYSFFFRVADNRFGNGISFPMFMIGAMLIKGVPDTIIMNCNIKASEDGINHFTLLRREK